MTDPYFTGEELDLLAEAASIRDMSIKAYVKQAVRTYSLLVATGVINKVMDEAFEFIHKDLPPKHWTPENTEDEYV